MSSENQVLRGLAFPGGCVDITADQSCTRRLYQKLSVRILAHRLVGGGEICNHRRPLERMPRPGRICYPEILTDLAADRKPVHRLTAEKNICAKRDFLPGK